MVASSTIFPLALSVNSGVIAAASNILSTNLLITSAIIPGNKAGILRIYISLNILGDVNTKVGVYDTDVLKGNLNADNSSELVSDGYYRFDIDVEPGDSLNFKSSIALDEVNFMRAHYIPFGA